MLFNITHFLVEILNTMLISLHERRKELSIMVAIGTRNHQLFLTLLLEALLLIFTGSLLGYLGGILLVFSLGDSGIDLSLFSNALQFFYMDAVIQPIVTIDSAIRILGTTLLSALLAGLYPAWKATRLDLGKNLRID